MGFCVLGQPLDCLVGSLCHLDLQVASEPDLVIDGELVLEMDPVCSEGEVMVLVSRAKLEKKLGDERPLLVSDLKAFC